MYNISYNRVRYFKYYQLNLSTQFKYCLTYRKNLNFYEILVKINFLTWNFHIKLHFNLTFFVALCATKNLQIWKFEKRDGGQVLRRNAVPVALYIFQ